MITCRDTGVGEDRFGAADLRAVLTGQPAAAAFVSTSTTYLEPDAGLADEVAGVDLADACRRRTSATSVIVFSAGSRGAERSRFSASASIRAPDRS